MKLCQEFKVLPLPGGIRNQDAYTIDTWVTMLNEEGKAWNNKMKKKGQKE